MFALLLSGWFSVTYDPFMWDKAEQIPGYYIIRREINKAVRGKDFFVNDNKTGKPVMVQGISFDDFQYYYTIWEDFHYFGLPGGRGSRHERRWLLDFLKIFEKSFMEIQALKNG